jgi:hypothetical protein
MSDTPSNKRSQAKPKREVGILASLPNTRPQRASARRSRKPRDSESTPRAVTGATAGATPQAKRPSTTKAATQRKPARKASTKTALSPAPSKPSASKVKATRAGKPSAKRIVKPAQPPAPRQGFEAGSEVERGLTVGPPSGLELATSVVGLVGEVAQAGASSGGRLLRGALARLQSR